MNKNNKHLRGATIAELIIVLAVLTIISTIVISFVVMSNENVRNSSQKVDALNDIAVVESIVNNWLSSEMEYLPSDYFGENDQKRDLDITINFDNKPKSYLKYDGINLYSSIRGSEVTYQPETITEIKTLIKKNEHTNEKIAICYITYELVLTDNTTNEYTYSFVVYPFELENTVIPGGN